VSDCVYEVFRQERKGQPFQHAGSFRAPNLDFAEVYAREFYGRRDESEALWVVPRDAVTEIDDFAAELDRSYRRVDGYSLKVRLREARDRAGTHELAPESATRVRDARSGVPPGEDDDHAR
jgi:phenylacetate-CoA oxygenase PaaH subunit